MGRAPGRGAGRLPQGVRGRSPPDRQGGQQTGRQAGEQGDRSSEREDGAVQPDGVEARRLGGREGPQEVQPQIAEQQPERRAAHREQRGSGDELADEPPSPGAHGGAQRQLAAGGT